MPQASHRYEGLRAHMAAGADIPMQAQIARALEVVEGGHENVKLEPLAFPQVETPDVSVVIPAHNRIEVTYLALASLLLAHNDVSFEVIVVDDDSTDDTRSVVAALVGQDPRIRLLANDRNAGQSASVHSGVLASRGQLIATLDGDGQNPPHELPRLLAPLMAADRPTDLGLVAGQRVKRQDSWSKKAASKFANGIRSFVLNHSLVLPTVSNSDLSVDRISFSTSAKSSGLIAKRGTNLTSPPNVRLYSLLRSRNDLTVMPTFVCWSLTILAWLR